MVAIHFEQHWKPSRGGHVHPPCVSLSNSALRKAKSKLSTNLFHASTSIVALQTLRPGTVVSDPSGSLRGAVNSSLLGLAHAFLTAEHGLKFVRLCERRPLRRRADEGRWAELLSEHAYEQPEHTSDLEPGTSTHRPGRV